MKIRYIFVLAGIIFPALTLHAQYIEDALRFSQPNTFGSARFQGMAGVNMALGADVSSIAGNPAGLGFFRKSEWSISAGLNFAATRANYLPYSTATATRTPDSKTNFNIPNLAVVFASPKSDIKSGPWRGGAFGISFTRLNSFQNQFTYNGTTDRSSFTNYLADQAYGFSDPELVVPDNQIGYDVSQREARAQLAYLGYLIAPDTLTQNAYYSSAGTEFLEVNQRETVRTTGARNQWNFSYGGNLNDKFYFGASVGLSGLRYGYEKTFREDILRSDNNIEGLRNFVFTDYYDVTGSGINASLGFIVKPNDFIRFGASVVTPTYYWNLREEFSSELDATFNTGSPTDLETVVNNYDYQLTTPLRLSGGLAVFAGKRGFVSADVEYITYNSARLSNAAGDDFSFENTGISNRYQPTLNYRLGGEFREGIFRARAGFAYFGDAIDQKERDNVNRAMLNLTAGVGMRLPGFYLDLALVHSRFNTGYSPYTFQNDPYYTNPEYFQVPGVTVRNTTTNAVLSFGTFF
jgi:hypothetical protein